MNLNRTLRCSKAEWLCLQQQTQYLLISEQRPTWQNTEREENKQVFPQSAPISLLLSGADKYDVQKRTPDVLRCIHIDVLRWNDLRKHLLPILSHVCITDVFS